MVKPTTIMLSAVDEEHQQRRKFANFINRLRIHLVVLKKALI